MKKFVKGVRFAPKNYSDEVEAKIQHYKREGYKLPSRHLLRTEEQLAGIRESARINTALLDYISENIREGMSTAEIDHMVYCFTTDHDAIPAPFLYEGFPKSVCVSINDVVCHGIPSTKEFLRSGDIVNVDVSTIYKGYFSDASRMYMIGEVSPEMQRLVQVTRSAATSAYRLHSPGHGWAMWAPPSRNMPRRTATAWCATFAGMAWVSSFTKSRTWSTSANAARAC